MCVYIFSYIHINTYMYTYIQYIYIHMYVYTCICEYLYMHTYAYIYIYIHVRIYIHTYTCTYIYTYTYICIYILTRAKARGRIGRHSQKSTLCSFNIANRVADWLLRNFTNLKAPWHARTRGVQQWKFSKVSSTLILHSTLSSGLAFERFASIQRHRDMRGCGGCLGRHS